MSQSDQPSSPDPSLSRWDPCHWAAAGPESGYILLRALEDSKEIPRETGKGSRRAGPIRSTGPLRKTAVLGEKAEENRKTFCWSLGQILDEAWKI